MSKLSHLLFLLIVIGIFMSAYLMLIPPTWVIDKQLGALKAGDIDKAYGLTSENFQKTTELITFRDYVDSIPVLQDSQGMAIHEELIDPQNKDVLIIKGVLKNSENKQIPIEYVIWREDTLQGWLEGWKIQSMKVQDQGQWKSLPSGQED